MNSVNEVNAVTDTKSKTNTMTAVTELQPGLYVVATPLGNLGDITLRALAVLKTVDCIACEDTRVTRDLLRLLNITLPTLISVREHNERTAAETVIARIAAGERVAYVSDAGTPAISDPGARLVAAVRSTGLSVIPLPGPSAVTAALSVAGLEATAFVFSGFAPTSHNERDEFIALMGTRTETTVFFESPHRAEKTLLALAENLSAERRVVVARELTKKFETISALTAGELAVWVNDNRERMRGEFVIVVAGVEQAPRVASGIDSRLLLKALLEELPASKAAKLVAKLTGESRDDLYAQAETLRKSR